MATHVNNHLNEKANVLSAELAAIVAHRFLPGILEVQVEYTNGDTSWHPIELIKNEDPCAIADYVINNDLGKIPNGKHRRWARTLLCTLRQTFKRLHRVQFYGCESTTYDHMPKIAHSHRAKWSRRAQAETTIPNPPKGKRDFKSGLKVPKNWMNIKRLDDVAIDTR